MQEFLTVLYEAYTYNTTLYKKKIKIGRSRREIAKSCGHGNPVNVVIIFIVSVMKFGTNS